MILLLYYLFKFFLNIEVDKKKNNRERKIKEQ